MNLSVTLSNQVIQQIRDAARKEKDEAWNKYKQAEQQYQWALGLKTVTPITPIINNQIVVSDAPRVLYWLASRSGRPEGHFIENVNGVYTCSCPGGQNRGSCWATDKVSKSPFGFRYRGTPEQFDNHRVVY